VASIECLEDSLRVNQIKIGREKDSKNEQRLNSEQPEENNLRTRRLKTNIKIKIINNFLFF
jgi:hypothetical protein